MTTFKSRELSYVGIETRPELTTELTLEASMMNELYQLCAKAAPDRVIRTGGMVDITGDVSYRQCLARSHPDRTRRLAYVEDMVEGNSDPTARRLIIYPTSQRLFTTRIYMTNDALPPVIIRENHKGFHPVDQEDTDLREAILELCCDEIAKATEECDDASIEQDRRLAVRMLNLSVGFPGYR